MVSELTKQINNDNLTNDEKLSFLNFLCGWMDKDNDKSHMIEMIKAYKSYKKDLLNAKMGKYTNFTQKLSKPKKINIKTFGKR